MTILRNVLAVLVILLLIISTFIVSVIIIVFYPPHLLLPRCLRNPIYRHFLLNVIVVWSDFNSLVLRLSTFGCWDLPSRPPRQMDKSFLILSNHQSWFDILVITMLTRHRLPSFLFFMKHDLLWNLPLAGIMCWMLGFPMLKRPSRESLRKMPNLRNHIKNYTQEICRRINRNGPRTIIIFPEGTRRRDASLKSAGCATMINELGDNLAGVIDMTLHYSLPKPSFWVLVSGKAKITVRYDIIDSEPSMFGDYYSDNNYKIRFQQWLTGLWEKKTLLLKSLDAK
jgi:1-acyl-sn-glycerol-3-phosphate acyltransferase